MIMVSILLIMFDDDNCTIAGQISDKDLASKHQLSDRCDLPRHFERSVVSDLCQFIASEQTFWPP